MAFYSNAIRKDILEELKLKKSIYRALERSELELYYQPQVNSRSGMLVGLEALIRWNHPERGVVGPGIFIPVAEKTGLIIEIGEWVVRTACRQNKRWQDMGLLKIPVAVNISARQFEDSNITEAIDEILNGTNLPAEYLEIEITEHVAFRELSGVVETLKRLKRLGVKITMDDFGTEYSSLNYIRQLPVDSAKIDKCFIDGIGANLKDEAIVKTMIALLEALELKVVAEGVETKRQVDFLAEKGCHIIQGFYYYKPMPADRIEKLLCNAK